MTIQPHEQDLSQDPSYRVLENVPLENVPDGSLIRVDQTTGSIHCLIARVLSACRLTDGRVRVFLKNGPGDMDILTPVDFPGGTYADILEETLTEEPAGLGAVVMYRYKDSRPSYYTRAQWTGSPGEHWVREGSYRTGGAVSWVSLQQALGCLTLVSPGYDPSKED